MLMGVNIWFAAFVFIFSYAVIREYKRPEISVKKGLNLMKKDLVKMIVFYQSIYPASDQIVLVKKWLDNIDKKEIPKEQLKLFKEYVNKL